jgi:hypothetical protein
MNLPASAAQPEAAADRVEYFVDEAWSRNASGC